MPSSNFNIYFAEESYDSLRIRKPAIVISPTSDKWNDFSYRTTFSYRIIGCKKEGSILGGLFLAFVDDSPNPAEDIQSRIIAHKGVPLSKEQVPEFYTMHHSLQGYRLLVRKLGADQARQLLLQINDLVAVQGSRPLPKWFATARTSKAFTLSFMRSNEAFYAFHAAGAILRGLDQESLQEISTSLRLRFKLPTFENDHELKLTFEQQGPLAKRMAVLIGKNAVGKSRSLYNIVESLLRDDDRLRTFEGGRPMIQRVLAFCSPGETHNTFPLIGHENRVIYRRVMLGRRPLSRDNEGLGSALVQLARSEESIKGQSRWDMFLSAASAFIAPDELYISPITSSESRRSTSAIGSREPVPLMRLATGSEQRRLETWHSVAESEQIVRFINGKRIPLSSGQAIFLRFAAYACLYVENGTILLFDEPETHLHPNLITEFVRLLDRLLTMTGSLGVLATHSAFFVREVPQSQVVVLRESRPKFIEATPPRLKTLGADIGSISHFVFGDEFLGQLVRDIAGQLKRDPENARRRLESLEKDLAPEAVMFLRRELSGSETP